ncbi:MAG: hypothetical protein P1P87_16380, partial [Trueperaceae bacterium]|nr:hypothetical protein [Trueperaceae bacterium]
DHAMGRRLGIGDERRDQRGVRGVDEDGAHGASYGSPHARSRRDRVAWRPHRAVLALFAVLLLATPAFAQDATITGTIDGQVDGVATSWYALQFLVDGERQDTVEVEDYGFTVDVTIQAHLEPRYLLRGALVLSASFGSLAACPCTAAAVEVFYLSEGTMFANVFKTEEGSMVIETATPLDDGRWRLEGRFAFDAAFHAEAFGEPDPKRRAAIEGTFDVEGGPLEF